MCYALRISDPPSIEKYTDKEAVRQLSSPPPKWSLEADEELAKFMADHVNKQEASLGNISRYVESVQVSSVSCLICYSKHLDPSKCCCFMFLFSGLDKNLTFGLPFGQ